MLSVLIGLDHIIFVLVVYELNSWGLCRMVDLSVAVSGMVREAVGGLEMGGVGVGGVVGVGLYSWKSVAFSHAALLRARLQNLLLHLPAVSFLWSRVENFRRLSRCEQGWVDDIWFLR